MNPKKNREKMIEVAFDGEGRGMGEESSFFFRLCLKNITLLVATLLFRQY